MGGSGRTRSWTVHHRRLPLDRCPALEPGGAGSPRINPSTIRGPARARWGSSLRVRTEPDRVILTDRHRSGGDDRKDESYPIYLDWTDCNLGGKRPWFLCPVRGCGRRVAILYGGGIFACRHCYQLAYPSQRETGYNRMARRANKLRDKLGWEPGFLNGNGDKPKGMHWNTFERLTRSTIPLYRPHCPGSRRVIAYPCLGNHHD